jgi:OOP family OmpA-OmpF porin
MRHIHIASLATAIASTLLFTPSSMAADPSIGWYVGGNVGQSRANIDDGGINATVLSAGFTSASTTKDETDTGFKVFAGFRFMPNFAIEAGYFNLGKVNFTTVTTPAATISGEAKSDNGFNLDLVGILPVTGGPFVVCTSWSANF